MATLLLCRMMQTAWGHTSPAKIPSAASPLALKMSTTNIRIKKNQSIDIKIVSELLKLMKPRVMSLVIFTCAVGLLISPVTIPLKEAMLGILFVAMGAGAAGTLNMWYEADLDKLMSRTCLRPIPRGKINRNQALVFGILLSITSVLSLSLIHN